MHCDQKIEQEKVLWLQFHDTFDHGNKEWKGRTLGNNRENDWNRNRHVIGSAQCPRIIISGSNCISATFASDAESSPEACGSSSWSSGPPGGLGELAEDLGLVGLNPGVVTWKDSSSSALATSIKKEQRRSVARQETSIPLDIAIVGELGNELNCKGGGVW